MQVVCAISLQSHAKLFFMIVGEHMIIIMSIFMELHGDILSTCDGMAA